MTPYELFERDSLRTVAFFCVPATVCDLIVATGMPVAVAYRRVKELADARMLVVLGNLTLQSGKTVPIYHSNVERVTVHLTRSPRQHSMMVELKDGTIFEESFKL